MGRAKPKIDFDRALSDLPQPLRWREYMMRVEAVIFAASQPVSRETLSAVIGSDCNFDLLIADIRDELRSRPYELVDVARVPAPNAACLRGGHSRVRHGGDAGG
jgi:segregation and condensation protein B